MDHCVIRLASNVSQYMPTHLWWAARSIGRPLFKDALHDGTPLAGAHVPLEIVTHMEKVEFSGFVELELELVNVQLQPRLDEL